MEIRQAWALVFSVSTFPGWTSVAEQRAVVLGLT